MPSTCAAARSPGSARLSPKSDSSDSVLDVSLRLYPNKKQSLSADLEASRNTNDIVTATNLFGMNINLGLRNRTPSGSRC